MEHGYPDIETVTLEDGAEELGTEEGDILDSLLPLAGKAALQVPPGPHLVTRRPGWHPMRSRGWPGAS